MTIEDAVKDALRKAFPGQDDYEEFCAWTCCVWSVAKAFGHEHPADEFFQFIYDCDPEYTPDWKASVDPSAKKLTRQPIFPRLSRLEPPDSTGLEGIAERAKKSLEEKEAYYEHRWGKLDDGS